MNNFDNLLHDSTLFPAEAPSPAWRFTHECVEILFVDIIFFSPLNDILLSCFEIDRFKLMHYMLNSFVKLGFWDITITRIP